MPNYQYINGTITVSSQDTDKLIETYKNFKKLFKKNFPNFILTQDNVNLESKNKTIHTKVRGSGFIQIVEIIELVKKNRH